MSLNISQLWFGLLIIFMMSSTGIDGQLEGFLKMNVSDDTIDAALQNDRMMQKQANCLMNYGRCDAIGRKVKGISIYLLNSFITNQNIYFIQNLKKAALPYVIDGKCPGCSEKQHQQVKRVMAELNQRYPAEYKTIYQMYSPKARG